MLYFVLISLALLFQAGTDGTRSGTHGSGKDSDNSCRLPEHDSRHACHQESAAIWAVQVQGDGRKAAPICGRKISPRSSKQGAGEGRILSPVLVVGGFPGVELDLDSGTAAV